MCTCVCLPLLPDAADVPGGGEREREGRGGGNYGSYDDSDPFTTNLYVGNIHPEVSSKRGRGVGVGGTEVMPA